MQAYIFNSLASAQAAQVAIDATEPNGAAYPVAGINFGGGVHAPAAQSATKTYAGIYQRPDGLAWAMLADGVTGPTASIRAASAIPTTLDFTAPPWLGAVQVWP